MAGGQDISIFGMKELIRQFTDLAEAPDEKNMENMLINRARQLRDKIKRNIPVNKKGSGSFDIGKGTFKYKTGNLKRALEVKKFKRKIRYSPAVFVRSNYWKAPHAHLVEFGTKNFRYPEKKRVLHFYYEGEEVFAKWVGPMPPNPYFRPTVDSNKNSIQNDIKKDVEEIIKEISDRK